MFQASLLKPSITITPLEEYTHHCTSDPRPNRACTKQALYAFAIVAKRDPATHLASISEHFACERHFGSAVQQALFMAKQRFDKDGHIILEPRRKLGTLELVDREPELETEAQPSEV